MFASIEAILSDLGGVVLLVGASAPATASKLRELGHNVLALAPLQSDSDRMAECDDFQATILAGLPPFDPVTAIVLEEYLIGPAPLRLFNSAYECLSVGGVLALILPAEGQTVVTSLGERRLGYLGAIAERCGFAPALLATPPKAVLCQPRIIAFRKCARVPRWQLMPLLETDLSQFITLFQEAFNATMSVELWRWKYGEGRGRSIAMRRNGRVIAHYGGTLRETLYFGRRVSVLQVCDVMVEPKDRGIMTKRGAMFLMTATFFEVYLGLQSFHLVFGFPSRRHVRLGEKLGLYGEVGRMMEIRWQPLPESPRLGTRLRRLERQDPGNGELIGRLWLAMSKDLQEAIVVIRDWAYLQYRYFDHPHHDYDMILVTRRFTRKPLGVVVLRRVGDDAELLDIVGPLKHIPLLIDQARRLTRRWGLAGLYCWITQQYTSHFADTSAQVRDLDVSVTTNIWVPGPSVQELRDSWWLMSGDTDFH